MTHIGCYSAPTDSYLPAAEEDYDYQEESLAGYDPSQVGSDRHKKPQRQNQHLCISINMIDEHLSRKSETWMDTRAREKEAGRLNTKREKKR